jgi:hypothetical protein
MNNDQFLIDCGKWIITLSVTSFEREEYRTCFSGGGVFNTMSVVSAMRSEQHTVLPDFPDNLDVLLSDPQNEFYTDANNYFAYWWVGQNLSGLSPVTSMFYFDAEEEAVSLDHRDLKSPVITRLGETWVVIEAGKWTDKYGLKCIRVGKLLSEAIVVWMTKALKHQWIIHDRKEDKMVDIRNSKLKDVWNERKKYVEPMDDT